MHSRVCTAHSTHTVQYLQECSDGHCVVRDVLEGEEEGVGELLADRPGGSGSGRGGRGGGDGGGCGGGGVGCCGDGGGDGGS